MPWPGTAALEVSQLWFVGGEWHSEFILDGKIVSGITAMLAETTGVTGNRRRTATSALAHPREVFRAAILANAAAIVCVHNHPSGDPVPSAADVQITQLLREASKTVEIALLDHVIIGNAEDDPLAKGFYSFREAGLL